MASFNINIMGNDLILTAADDAPPDTHRLGSVPLYFDDKPETFIRVYGNLKIYADPKKREAFERELRQACENPIVLEQVVPDLAGFYPKTRRFNVSWSQRKRGWYNDVKKSEHTESLILH